MKIKKKRMTTIQIAMRQLGQKTSEAKKAAVRENGKKGGRPRKPINEGEV